MTQTTKPMTADQALHLMAVKIGELGAAAERQRSLIDETLGLLQKYINSQRELIEEVKRSQASANSN